MEKGAQEQISARYGESGKKSRRLRIGYVADNIDGPPGLAIWNGIVDAAQQADVNLLCIVGGRLRKDEIFREYGTILYELINREHVDGLIFWSSSMCVAITEEETVQFHQRYAPLPIVTLTMPVAQYPVVTTDNVPGMRAMLEHLIDDHGYRRIAFVRGPENHIHAQERYQVYCEMLSAHHIPLDPALVTPPKTWFPEIGVEAGQMLFDERRLQPGVDVEAMVCASDNFAIPLIAMLQERGLQIPHDLAVVGVNDLPEGRCLTPPLTTVAIPLYDQGYHAVEVLLATLRGQPVSLRTALPSRLIVRQSCGCLNPSVLRASKQCTRRRARRTSLEETRQQLLEELHRIVIFPAGTETDVADRLLKTVLSDLSDETDGAFLRTLEEVLRSVMLDEGSVLEWQDVVSGLREVLLSRRTREQLWGRAERLIGSARVLLGEIAYRAQAYQGMRERKQAAVLRHLSQTLITTFAIPELMNILAMQLPTLGIASCYLVMYENPQPYQYPQPASEWARVMMAYVNNVRATLDLDGRRVLTRQIVPDDLWPAGRRVMMVMQSLHFREEQIGFVVFEPGPRDGLLYHQLSREISSALQGALLVQRIQERSAEIVRQKYILDTFIETVPDRIWFKDREGRFTRTNKAHAAGLGLPDPAEQIGKTDLDFFGEIAGKSRMAEEQEILWTGQPMFNKEVSGVWPDGSQRWSLITKMPLRDEHGAIIGTFGIARDITELKKAQQALAQAYSEISVLNVQLQEENVRMGAELNVVKQLQQMILPRPQELANIPGLDIVGYMQPADEVGGDYYDVLHNDGMLHIGIGDVTGHGLESGVLMLMTQAAIRTLIEHGETDPVKFVNTLNRLIYKNAQRIGTDKNLTFALVQYEHGQFKLVGQHEELLVVRQNGAVERVNTMDLGFPVGLEAEISQWVNAATITLQPGDGIILYTDGITEAENSTEDLYGVDRLCDVISRNWAKPVEAIKQAVIDDVFTHIGTHTMYDDITLVILKQK